MTFISKFIILSLIVTFFYLIGLLTFIIDYGENKCEMTYMFEYPQFVKIKVQIEEQLPRYGLYAYSEGKLTEKARAMKFDGIPVLFIPGNAGSFKQVRSLSSVALRKALNSRTGYHFDFFTLDLNEELSGLNGAVLNEQTKFLNHSLYRILELYDRKKPNAPKSVILIGHSMGGVIAHNIIADFDNFNNVELLLTLATPHQRPTIYLDSSMANYYNQITSKFLNNTSYLENKTIITIGGGFNDRLVNSGLTKTNFSSLNVITTAVPKVWISIDHPCIVWCKQLVLSIIRALFDAVDLKTKQLSTDHNYRLNVFKHHLIKNSGTNIRFAERYKILTKLDDRGEWREDIRRLYTVSLPKGISSNQWLMIRIFDDPKHEALFVQAVNLAVTDWIFACTADSIRGQSRYCETGIHLSHLSKIAPSNNYIKRRTHYINLFRLKKRYPQITHVVVRVYPTSDPVSINFDVHNPADRSLNIQVPKLFSLSRNTIISKTIPEAMFYEIKLNGLQYVIQAYMIHVEPLECTESTHHATISFSAPWDHHDIHHYITESSKKPLLLRLHNSRLLHQNNLTAKITLTLDPTCQYSISIRNSIIGMMGQFARYYSPFIIANVAAVILLSYRSQLNSLEENGYCTLFQSSLSMCTKPYYLITSAKLIAKLLPVQRFSWLIPIPDTQIIFDENLEFLVLPLLLYVIAVGITYLFSLLLWAGILMNESTIHKLIGKFFTRTIGGTFKMSEWVMNAMHRVSCVVAATLICLGMTTCGSLALCLGLAYYFLKLTQLCQDCLEGLAYKHIKRFIFNLIRKVFRINKKNKKDDKNSTLSTDTENENKSKEESVHNDQIENKKYNNTEDNNSTSNKNSELNTDTKNENKSKEESIDNDQIENKTYNNTEDSNSASDEEENALIENNADKDNEINNIKLRKMESTSNNDESNQVNCETEIKTDDKLAIANNSELETKNDSNGDSTDHSEMHFHFTLFLLWFIVAALNIPSVLTWAHNFKYNNVLNPDSSSLFGIVLCLCAIPLWQLELPRTNKKFYKQLGYFVYGMALLCLIYAPINVYRVSYILTTILLVTVIHQLLAPNKTEDEMNEEETDELDPIALLKDIKDKLE